MGFGIGIGDWKMGLGISIENCDLEFGLEISIRDSCPIGLEYITLLWAKVDTRTHAQPRFIYTDGTVFWIEILRREFEVGG